MQVDHIKPSLKAPGIKLLKLKYDKLLSNFAFKFNLRRYTLDDDGASDPYCEVALVDPKGMSPEQSQAGAYTRPLFSST